MQSSFQVGDNAVHPAHGLGEVTGIERREIAGATKAFYVVKILETGMRVMVPTQTSDSVGLRTVMSQVDADSVMDVFKTADKAVGAGPWNRRQRAYNEMIKSGSPHEVAKVLRGPLPHQVPQRERPLLWRASADGPGARTALQGARDGPAHHRSPDRAGDRGDLRRRADRLLPTSSQPPATGGITATSSPSSTPDRPSRTRR